MDNHSAMIAALIGALIGSIVSSVSHVLTFATLVTAAVIASVRYVALYRGADPERIARLTTYGFFVGVALSALFLLLNSLIGG